MVRYAIMVAYDMTEEPEIKPLSKVRRRWTFVLLFIVFVGLLPVLYLYATGYRFDLGQESMIVSTGGLYIAADRTDVNIYIDDELVEDTRVFRRAYYAQSLEPKTHRITVQKEDHHTWVKELPVYAHLVTEAQAFNMPLVPRVRVVSQWLTPSGVSILAQDMLHASATNPVTATSTKATSTFLTNGEYINLLHLFSTSSATSTDTFFERIVDQVDLLNTATTTSTSTEVATTTKEWKDVRLYEDGGDMYATWLGDRDDMPYYYCAELFEPYSSTTPEDDKNAVGIVSDTEQKANIADAELIHPVQKISEDAVCNPVIQIDRKGEEVKYFDFYPGSADLVVLALETGVYVVEVDNRAWQNMQPIFLGENLDVRIENGNIYVYDGELIYEVVLDD